MCAGFGQKNKKTVNGIRSNTNEAAPACNYAGAEWQRNPNHANVFQRTNYRGSIGVFTGAISGNGIGSGCDTTGSGSRLTTTPG